MLVAVSALKKYVREQSDCHRQSFTKEDGRLFQHSYSLEKRLLSCSQENHRHLRRHVKVIFL